MALLEVKNLRKHFPIYSGVFRHQTGSVKAVDGVSFSIEEGEVLGMVGESGCGKSTAGRCALRLIEPTEGEILYQGNSLLDLEGESLRELRQDLQMVFQDPFSSLNPRKSIGESLLEPVLFHQKVDTRKQGVELVAQTLEQVGLSADVMHRYPHEFSGGQQQRICIGRAIILRPKLIVCDEAVSALDVSVQAQILNLLHQLKEEMGLSYLFISHDLSVIRHLCDRVVVLYLGQVMEQAPVDQLFEDPKHPYTQALISSIPKLHPSHKRTAQPLEGSVPSPINPPSGCPFRTRCPRAESACAGESPPKREHGPGHLSWCVQ